MIQKDANDMANSRLFKPLKLGTLNLQHRLVMAPLTRYRANENHVQLPFTADYYSQRASVPGTLLITEATFISQKAAGYNNVPGIWSQEQIEAWRKVTDAVHAKGSYIYLQLWAIGRVAQPEVLKSEGNYDVVGASPIPETAEKTTPRELSESEIKSFVGDYAQAAKNAVHGAGFDGVEIHGANGYLVDQFLQDVSNQRTDQYGGSIENRSRFALEVASAVVDAVGGDRVGIRLSPYSPFQGMGMDDPVPQFSHVIQGLAKLNLAYLHVIEARIRGNTEHDSTASISWAVDTWNASLPTSSQQAGVGHPVLLAGGYTPSKAIAAVDEEYPNNNVAVVFGRYFLSTPDLVYRIQNGIELNKYNRDTFYIAMSKEGYIDYPYSKEFKAEHPDLVTASL